jgi:carboxyl-terminal processing protease
MKQAILFCIVLALIFIAIWSKRMTSAHAEPAVEQLTRKERISGLKKLWKEVKHNFAWFDQVPDLDWDKALQEYLPKAAAEQTNAEYYKLLQRFLALLHDGHTSLGLSGYNWGRHIWQMMEAPPISIKNIEGKAVIAGFSETNEIKEADISPGMEITRVDGRPVDEILQQDIYPFVSASTPQERDDTAYGQILKGAKGSKVSMEIQDMEGDLRTVILTRDSTAPEARSVPWWNRPPVELKRFPNGIAYVAIKSFMSKTVISEFDQVFDGLENVEGMIIDVRNNGGGNSIYGHAIISRLTSKPLRWCRWQSTRRYRRYLLYMPTRVWFWVRRIRPRGEKRFLGPLVVLTNVNTGSAAEDFLAILHGNKRATVVGGRTCGSTGQPVLIDLPGGAHARICAARVFYPDGRPFVGVGVIPDVEVYPTRKDIADGRDVMLEKALEVLKGKSATAQ